VYGGSQEADALSPQFARSIALLAVGRANKLTVRRVSAKEGRASTMPSDPPSSSPTSRLPRKLGAYLLFDRIGAGGMAEIFLARAKTELGGQRLLVVKQILPGLAAHPKFAEMLIHEAKLAARLDHANVAQVYDLGRADEQLFIAMEYVEGFDLNDLLRRCTKEKVAVPIELALSILTDTLRGLDYAHRRTAEDGQPLGIVHRDVSPSNVLVSFDGQVKVCDFGIAHANDLVANGESTRETAEALKGKAGYMSPEHARGEAVDARADVFAVGILLWELLAGKRMYRYVDGGPTLLEQARRAEVRPPPERGLENEATLHAIVMKALSASREERYASAALMLRDIERYLADAGLVVSPIRLGDWLVASLGSEIVLQRRKRQRAAEALALGPPVTLTPLPFQPVGAMTAPTPTPVVVVRRTASSASPTPAPTPTPTPTPAPTPNPTPNPTRPARGTALVFGAVGVLVLLLGCFYALRGP
jgi:serine/threonine protein kinase